MSIVSIRKATASPPPARLSPERERLAEAIAAHHEAETAHAALVAANSWDGAALKTYNQTGTASNNYLTGIATFGSSSMYYWNGAVSNPYDTVFGNSGCAGSSTGTVNFTGVTCLGPHSGIQLTGATNSILINGGGPGGCVLGCTNFSSGSGVILIASGKTQIDTPAAGTTNFINEEDTYIASTVAPSWVSDFNNNAGFHGGTGGGTSWTTASPFRPGCLRFRRKPWRTRRSR